MSSHEPSSPVTDMSELEDSPFHDSKGPKSDAARIQEIRGRVRRGGLEEATQIPHISPERLLPTRPKKRPRTSIPTQPNTIYQRIDAVRQSLGHHNLTIAEMVRVMCAYDYGEKRAKEDFDFQLSRDEAKDAQNVQTWAKEIACQEILREGKRMEKLHFLNTNANFSTVDSLKDWSPNVVYQHLCNHMPYLVSLLESFIKDGEHSSETKQDEVPTTVSVVGSILWIKRSQRANLLAKGFTTYLYSSGVRAATINVLNRLGLGVSYSTLLDSLSSLNRSCTERFREAVAPCRAMFCWDNVNFEKESSEQRIKNSGSFESGTAATVIELHPPPGCEPEAIDEALDLDKYLAAIESASDLNMDDVVPTLEDEEHLCNEFVYETINVLVEHAGELFKGFKKTNDKFRPLIRLLLPLRVSKVHPLPTLHIEQASANGNATVTEELRRITQIDKSEVFKRRILIATGDLLTIMRLLSVRDVRTLYMRTPAHIEDKHENLSYLVPFASLFHIRIAAATAILQTHFGKPNVRPEDGPASLWRHNEILKRKNIPLSQAFKYRTAQDLTFHSLYARLLDVVRIESGCESLHRFGDQIAKLPHDEAWNRLKSVVSAAILRFTTPEEAGTDDVLRNSVLFIRDALLFRCFVTSIKCGNMAMIELILKIWVISFRGSGRSQYASELLRLRHNLVHAWPKPLRDLILSNMLVNTTGRANGWKEIDLLQEHMNYWIKARYIQSPWLQRILEVAGRNIYLYFYPTRHTTPNLEPDLELLVKSLVEARVHERDPARHLDKTLRAKDALVSGLHSIEARNSINEFNKYRFGARSAPFGVAPPSNTDANECDDDIVDGQEPQTQGLFNVVVHDGDGNGDDEEIDPFDFD